MPKVLRGQETPRKKVAGGSVNDTEYATIEAGRVKAGYPHMSEYVREAMLAVSTSDSLLQAVLAVSGRAERRAA